MRAKQKLTLMWFKIFCLAHLRQKTKKKNYRKHISVVWTLETVVLIRAGDYIRKPSGPIRLRIA